ncbi:MAG: hypothetical protein KAY32_09010 [Candidatus Eisenbacteria sp.]|nr:hypothetical protein [Candidatus Eisenbacteria bacterium]
MATCRRAGLLGALRDFSLDLRLGAPSGAPPICLLTLLLMLGLPPGAVTARAAPVKGEPSLAGGFIHSTTERRLVEQIDTGWGAGLADTAWTNDPATIWTFSIRPGQGDLTAAEAAARLTHGARQSRLGRLLFRHVLGWRGANAQQAPEGILPLGDARLRFLLERPDPHFPARLSAWETSLCVDRRSGLDPGCGRFQVQTRLTPWRQEIRDPTPAFGELASWERTGSPEKTGPPVPLLELLGHWRLAPEDRVAARIRFFLPPLPAYCQAESPVSRAGTPFLVHLALLLSPDLRASSSVIAARLAAGPLLPGGERSGWHATRRLLPGRARDTELATAPPSPAREAEGAAPQERYRVSLRFPEGWPVMHCVAERIRALLWPAGWDVALLPQPAPDGPHLPPMEEAGIDLRLAITAKRSEAWDQLRMLFAWADPATLSAWEAVQRTEDEDGTASIDVLEEEWRMAEDLEARLLAGGELIPLLLGPIDWWMEAPSRPQVLLHGLAPLWGEPHPPLVVLRTGGRLGRAKNERADDEHALHPENQ